jgi:hypothetical protein
MESEQQSTHPPLLGIKRLNTTSHYTSLSVWIRRRVSRRRYVQYSKIVTSLRFGSLPKPENRTSEEKEQPDGQKLYEVMP